MNYEPSVWCIPELWDTTDLLKVLILEKKVNTSNANILKSTVKNIYSITPFTLLDFPGHPSCIFWFSGCNMRCLYCYNPDIVLGKGTLSYNDALEFLKTRVGLLNGVVMSGGECSLHPHFIAFVTAVKKMGFLVKVDTNGSRPKVLKTLASQGLIDYVALDFKAMPEKEVAITGGAFFEDFTASLELLQSCGMAFEVRTTVHKNLLSTDDILTMSRFLNQQNYQGVYYLQNFKNGVPTLGDVKPSGASIDLMALEKSKIPIAVRN